MDDEFIGRCGISAACQERLGGVLFVEFPDTDIPVRAGEKVARVESDSDIFDVRTPVTGVIVEVNRDLEDDPGLIDRDPHGNGWVFMIDVSRVTEFDDLLTQREYEEYVAGEVT